MGIMPGHEKVEKEYVNTKMEGIAKREEHYMQLLRSYKEEIAEIESMMREIRKERESFYQSTLPQIEATIQNDKVLSEDAKKEWIQELRANMEKSLRISEELIQKYVTSHLAEFNAELIQAKNRM